MSSAELPPLDVLFAGMPVPGHTAPLLPIARELVARGHRVRWCAGRRFADQVTATGAVFEPMSESIDHDGRAVDDLFPERTRLSGIAKLRYDIRAVFLDPIPTQLADLRRLVAERPVDVVVHDSPYAGAAALSALDGVPSVSVGISPLGLASPHTAPFGLGMQPGSGPVSRLRNRALQELLDRVVLRSVRTHLTRIQDDLGIPRTTRTKGLGGASALLHLQNGVASFEHPRPDLPGHVHFVGALVDQAPPGDLPDWWADIEHAGKPVVHVTQGTVADLDLEHLVLPTLRALADEDVLVVASTGTRDTRAFADVPDNARLAPFLPYDLLLPRLSAMVTNGGFGGVQRALSHGVPLVVAGTTEDKPEVAARVARAGVGVNLRTGTPKPEAIRAAVRRVLDTPAFRDRAVAMGAEYRALDAGKVSADLVEELVRSTVSKPLPETPRRT